MERFFEISILELSKISSLSNSKSIIISLLRLTQSMIFLRQPRPESAVLVIKVQGAFLV